MTRTTLALPASFPNFVTTPEGGRSALCYDSTCTMSTRADPLWNWISNQVHKRGGSSVELDFEPGPQARRIPCGIGFRTWSPLSGPYH
ncbi:hypothetical protein AVEN_172108-1 [Araneus ventricosus]|uniref:Uncharacterized protein n=1 Tax=Araneus ventricosus TaxID=182803 RepID=A0A4Y2SVZ9_ARAVE|nr:hypothetical protein AVEN_172108-1 [Araneus ventricosus]